MQQTRTPEDALKHARHLERLANQEKDADKKARLKLAAKRSRWVAKSVRQLRKKEAESLTASALDKARESASRKK